MKRRGCTAAASSPEAFVARSGISTAVGGSALTMVKAKMESTPCITGDHVTAGAVSLDQNWEDPSYICLNLKLVGSCTLSPSWRREKHRVLRDNPINRTATGVGDSGLDPSQKEAGQGRLSK
ncbi:hypothetical protein ACP70R_032488 [Stipagrostis hirtigluma subsp. patula]